MRTTSQPVQTIFRNCYGDISKIVKNVIVVIDYIESHLHEKLDLRIDAAVEPYPGRWTHHVLIAGTGEIDDKLMGWIKEAAAFSDQKR